MDTSVGPTLPEQYFIPPTKYVPNSDLPVLVYRNVLPSPYEEVSTSQFLEAHNWEKGVCLHSFNSQSERLDVMQQHLIDGD